MSPGWEKITGRSCESLYQHPESWTEIIHPEDRARILGIVQPPLCTEGRQIEYRIVRPDGAIRWIRDRAFAIRNEAGAVHRVAGIGEDITERMQAEAKIQEYYEREQALSRQLLTIQEEERRHLARELHDEIGQSLTGLRFLLEADPDLSLAAARGKLQDARAAVDGLLAKVRELSFDLRPAMLDHLGLLSALLWLFERYTAQTKVQVHFRHEGITGRFAPEIETAAFRLIQEALTNVARHARVNEVSVRVWLQEKTLNLQVEDEGAGVVPGAAPASNNSSGLAGMYERTRLLGGQLLIDSAPGEGTQLMVRLPLSS
jgi:PAS domain S-box-containing protein